MNLIFALPYMGVSSNGRTRDFESLNLGSNPNAPSKPIAMFQGNLRRAYRHRPILLPWTFNKT